MAWPTKWRASSTMLSAPASRPSPRKSGPNWMPALFDALTHERSYRRVLSREEAPTEMKGGAGTQFDPRVVEAFLALLREGEATG